MNQGKKVFAQTSPAGQQWVAALQIAFCVWIGFQNPGSLAIADDIAPEITTRIQQKKVHINMTGNCVKHIPVAAGQCRNTKNK